MGKRSHGEGTVFERKDRPGIYRAQFSYNDPATGKTVRKAFDRPSRREALAAGKRWIEQTDGGLLPDADKLTLGEWIDRWLEDYAKQRIRVKSYEKYEGCLRLYIKPALGGITITRLKSPDIQRVFNQLLEHGGKDKKGISPLTIKNTRRYLISCLEQAVKDGLLPRNIAKNTNPPKITKMEVKPLNEEQSKILTATAKETGALPHMVILLTLSTGMRLGEVFGLKWDDIDIDRGIIRVQRELVTSNHTQYFEEPKTAKSRRQIPLPADINEYLKEYKTWQDEQKQSTGDKWADDDMVFAGSFGQPYNPHNFSSRNFKVILRKAGLDTSVKFHDLRHTHATLLLQQGINPKIVQERLGHSTITLTMDTYSHLLPDMQGSAIKALEGLFTTDKKDEE